MYFKTFLGITDTKQSTPVNLMERVKNLGKSEFWGNENVGL